MGSHVAGANRAVTETSILFSEQLVELCRVRKIGLLAIGTNGRRDRIVDGNIILEQRPKPFMQFSGGLAFHLREVIYGIWLAWRAARYKPDVAIIDSGTSHYFTLTLLAWMRIPVAVNFHNVLWPQGFPRVGRVARIVRALDGRFMRRHAVAILGCSPECGIQATSVARKKLPFFEWRAQFRRFGFPSPPRALPSPPLRVLFVGRAEREKGLLDIPGIAKGLNRNGSDRVIFDVCGDGSALAELQECVVREGLEKVIKVHGRLNRPALLKVYGNSDLVIVPTRSTFREGMPLVCAEAMISGRPIVTSRLSNALPILGAAISEATPDDVESYVEAIERLLGDPEEYNRRRAACADLAVQFFDLNKSYPAAVDQMLVLVKPDWRPLSNYDEVFASLIPA